MRFYCNNPWNRIMFGADLEDSRPTHFKTSRNLKKNLPNAFRRATNDVCEILYKGFQRILMGNFGANDVRSSTKVPKGFP